MRTRFAIGTLTLLFVGLLGGSASAGDDTPDVPKCITMTAEARASGGAYDHVVSFKNACGAAAACTVSTDQQPNPIWADLPNASDTAVVVTRGSNETSFQPHVFCMVGDR